MSANDSGRSVQNPREVAQIVCGQNEQSMRVKRSDPLHLSELQTKDRGGVFMWITPIMSMQSQDNASQLAWAQILLDLLVCSGRAGRQEQQAINSRALSCRESELHLYEKHLEWVKGSGRGVFRRFFCCGFFQRFQRAWRANSSVWRPWIGKVKYHQELQHKLNRECYRV